MLDTNSAYDVAVRGEILPPVDTFTPFMITLDRTSPNVDYNQMKSKGVVGVLIELGYLYDSIHREQHYRNPKLTSQVEAAVKAEIPFALYADVKSRSVEESKRELYELELLVRNYSPNLGLWLRLMFTSSKVTNNNIIDTYYTNLVRMGLQDQIGFYVTESQLSTIDWDKYQDKWYLWLNRHIPSMDNLGELQTPQMFVI